MRHRSVSMTVLLAIAVLITSATPAMASWTPTTVILGSPGTWTRFANYGNGENMVQVDCPSGAVTSVSTAISDGYVTTDGYLNGTLITCTPFARDGMGIDLVMAGATTTPAPLGVAGSGGGTATCPGGQVAVGLRPYVGDVIGGFTLLCRGLDDHQPAGLTWESAVIGGNSGTPDIDPMVCSTNQVLTGLNAEFTYYDMVDKAFASFGMQCSTIEASGDNFQPDGAINSVGASVVDDTGTLQAVTRKIPAGRQRVNWIDLWNQGDGWDTLKVQAEGSQGPFKVSYNNGGRITPDVIDGSYGEGVLAGASTTVSMKVQVKEAAKRGTKRTWTFNVTSSGAGGVSTDVLVLTLIVK